MISNWLERNSLYLALAAAWIAMCGSLYFSEVAGYIPCRLCWEQRILMYPLTVIIAVGLLTKDQKLPFYILPFSVLGIGFSTYHYLLQKTDLVGGATACQEGVPCTTMWFNWLGFITIPFLALTAFMIITIATLIAMQTDQTVLDRADATPGVPVFGLIGALVALFLVLGFMGSRNQADPLALPITTVIDADIQQTAASIDGALLYRQACAACHGPVGEGVAGLGNSLTQSTLVAELSDAEMLAFVRAGRGTDDPANTTGLVMPASGGRPDLNDAEMLAVIAHLHAINTAASTNN